MQSTRQFTALIERDGDLYVAHCAELDVTSQGSSVEESRANLIEAIELFLETAPPDEIKRRLRDEVFITRVEVKVA
jgi:predicted RNase H-like HicB family nuclease